VTTWFNVPDVNYTMIDFLNYSNASDEVEIDIRIQAPPGETAGSKSSSIWFVAELDSEVGS
jgi:hypothetical protein